MLEHPKVFELGIGNELGISYRLYGFGVKRSKVEVMIRVRVGRRDFAFYRMTL